MSNPYESPVVPSEPRSEVGGGWEKVGVSVIMILLGAFFFVAHASFVVKIGFAGLVNFCRTESFFTVGWLFFYGLAGGLTAVFHVCYLSYGRPAQHLAGVWAIGLALGLTGLAVVVLKLAG